MAMLDSGATHNFVADREIQKLGLTLAQHSSRIKVVNLEAKPIQGVACVELKVRVWTGKCNLMAVPLDDFDVILGMDFLQLANTMDFVRLAEKKDSLMSAMQVKASLTHGEQTYLAALIEIKSDVVQEVPDEVAELLHEFKDVFPPELPKKLPPRRKQLDGLLEAGLVQPSKASYGSPVLFQRKQDGSMRMCVDYRSLNKFVVVYLDDIVIYSKTLNEHVKHLRAVFQRLREYELYAKKEKCEFCYEQITFLGHVISQGKIQMDQKRRFIMGYSKIVNPLKDLLRKDQKWERTVVCDDAFRSLKQAISSQPVLKLPRFDKPFEVQVDASDRALGGVLVQDKHPVGFESRKLKDAELQYNTHEKEMTVVINCLEAWRTIC
ncbi:UNVERIFIED_CONTAM: Retrovirus-related Pol polyprotein from transposon.6 [Sesamum radiatum]|uniref:Retrovirus-related Pol polyprotein from transposon.6 n=1 Tax=Sesamum radiatum TaxID=300843 RepID=A0AAW2MZ92_SESRA